MHPNPQSKKQDGRDVICDLDISSQVYPFKAEEWS